MDKSQVLDTRLGYPLREYWGIEVAKGARILFVTDYAYPAGGIEQSLVEIVSRANALFECRILSWSDQVLCPNGFTATYGVEYGDVRAPWEQLDWADLIFVVTSFNVRLLARLVTEYKLSSSTPLVTSVQTSEHSRPGCSSLSVQNAWLRELLLGSERIVAVSTDVSDAIMKLFEDAQDSVPSELSISVIENASRFATCQPRLQRGRKEVGFVGRPFEQKGYPLFERLATDLRTSGLRFHANTVSGPPHAELDNVTYSFGLNSDEMVSFFDRIDVLVAPYIRADGLPLAVVEALSCGVPVIGFDSPGVGLILRRYNQIVLEPDYEELRFTVELWASGGLTLSSPTRAVYSWDEAVLAYFSIFAELVGE